MQRSIALGHCVCDPQKPCPCPVFKEKDICECAGERLPVKSGTVRLTENVRAAGCASKIGKKDLKEILSGLPDIDDSRVIVGRSAGDDAGVIMLDESTATVLTVDVFAPSVDDPYTFGQIAAANSLSDIYAMGADAQAALSIIGFPIHELPPEAMREILRGGIEKMAEAGVSVIGGHSINDSEIKCGFAVTGTAPAGKLQKNTGAKFGDVIILTKPLGTGITSFAGQIGWADSEDITQIIKSMTMLNKRAGELMRKYNASAATDVTGFSLLGHISEIVKNSNIEIEIDFDALPLFSKVVDFAACGALPGAVERNRESVAPELIDFTTLPECLQNILYGPETSGGLLVFLTEDDAQKYIAELKESGNDYARIIGKVCSESTGGKIRVKSAGNLDTDSIRLRKTAKFKARVQASTESNAGDNQSSCCDSGAESSCCSDTNNSSNAAQAEATQSCCSGGDDPRESTSQKQRNLPAPAASSEFSGYMAAVNKSGAIDVKNKKLMALALSVSHKCAECVIINTEAARKQGATDAELSEAVAMGISFGGASANMFYQQLVNNR